MAISLDIARDCFVILSLKCCHTVDLERVQLRSRTIYAAYFWVIVDRSCATVSDRL